MVCRTEGVTHEGLAMISESNVSKAFATQGTSPAVIANDRALMVHTPGVGSIYA